MTVVHRQVVQSDSGSAVSAALTKADGTPIDLTSALGVSFIMRAVGGLAPVVDAPATVVAADEGKVRYDLTAEDIETPGDYSFVFKVTHAEGTITYPTSGPLLLRVLPDLNSDDNDPEYEFSWCSIADAKRITGQDVTPETLALAHGNIEVSVGKTTDETLADDFTLTSKDAAWLMRAAAYQAAWLADQPDLHSRLSVTSTTQNGMSVNLTEDAVIIGPLARRAILRLSWMGSRVVPVSRYRPYTGARDELTYRPW